MEFLLLSGRRSSTRNGLAAKSTEKRMFSQASVVETIVQLAPICILTCSLHLVLFFSYLEHYLMVLFTVLTLRYHPPFRTVRVPIAVALVVFIKTPINHIFFKSLIIPDYGFELTKTIYLNVFRNWNALCKCTRLYKSCSTPARNKRGKTINTAFASQHVPLKNCLRFLTSAFVFLLLANY